MMIKTPSSTSPSSQHGQREAGLCALVPVKLLEFAKQRLEPCLGPDREKLTMAMLADVLAALAESRNVTRTAVITGDERVAEFAGSRGAWLIREESQGLNAAVRQGLDTLHHAGCERAVILPADLPLLTGAELDRVLTELDAEQHRGGNRVIGLCASKDGKGTNLLSLETGLEFQTAYGPNSYRVHREAALGSQCRPVALHSAALALDIDRKQDLDEFVSWCLLHPEHQDSETWNFLQSAGLVSDAGQLIEG